VTPFRSPSRPALLNPAFDARGLVPHLHTSALTLRAFGIAHIPGDSFNSFRTISSLCTKSRRLSPLRASALFGAATVPIRSSWLRYVFLRSLRQQTLTLRTACQHYSLQFHLRTASNIGIPPPCYYLSIKTHRGR
jgi:hypothetical protein